MAVSVNLLRATPGGAIHGLVAALLLALIPTALDWYENPAGIFHSASGTDWSIVLETASSWFWPLALYCVPLAILVQTWRMSRRVDDN